MFNNASIHAHIILLILTYTGFSFDKRVPPMTLLRRPVSTCSPAWWRSRLFRGIPIFELIDFVEDLPLRFWRSLPPDLERGSHQSQSVCRDRSGCPWRVVGVVRAHRRWFRSMHRTGIPIRSWSPKKRRTVVRSRHLGHERLLSGIFCHAGLNDLDINRMTRPLYLALSYDEEIGCLGIDPHGRRRTRPFSQTGLRHHWRSPRACGSFAAHKVDQRVSGPRSPGQAAHSSQPHRGAGAYFLRAARIIEQLRLIGEERRAAAVDSGFEPPWTTVQARSDQRRHRGSYSCPRNAAFCWEYRGFAD